jgi:glutathione S-transferase
MKLIGSLPSPFTRKTRIVAAEKRVEYVWEVQNVWAPDNPVADYNPLGKVPVLVLDDGTALYDSRVICEFLDSVSPIGKLLPVDHRERIEVRRWEALADGVLEAGVLARLEGMRPAGERSQPWIERQMGKVVRGLDALDIEIGAAVVPRERLHARGHRGRRVRGLARLPLPAARMAQGPSQPRAARGQARRAAELRGDDAARVARVSAPHWITPPPRHTSPR